MKIDVQNKLKDFIIKNGLTFQEGVRNRDSVIISGYALHLGITDQSDIEKVIDSTCTNFYDLGYKEELNRVFYYAKENNYEDYWNTAEAKNKYTF